MRILGPDGGLSIVKAVRAHDIGDAIVLATTASFGFIGTNRIVDDMNRHPS